MDNAATRKFAYVYTLSDPLTGKIRYVGVTTHPLKERLARHLNPSGRKEGNPKSEWVRGLHEMGLQPIIGLVETILSSKGDERERDWIGHFRTLGCDLLNQTNGGRKGTTYSAETRAKLKELLKKRGPVSDEIKARISAGTRGKKRRPRSPEIKEKIRQALTGRKRPPFSAEWKANMSKAAKAAIARRKELVWITPLL